MPDDSSTPIEGHDPWARMRDRHCACLRSKEMFYDNGIPLRTAVPAVFLGAARRTSRGPDELWLAWKIAAPTAPATGVDCIGRGKKPL
jgi:hypothetical protein